MKRLSTRERAELADLVERATPAELAAALAKLDKERRVQVVALAWGAEVLRDVLGRAASSGLFG